MWCFFFGGDCSPETCPLSSTSCSFLFLLLQANGDSYEGEYQDNEMHGWGIYTYADGDYYEGEFRHGKPHGKGTYYHASGQKTEGYFHNGRYVGPEPIQGESS